MTFKFETRFKTCGIAQMIETVTTDKQLGQGNEFLTTVSARAIRYQMLAGSLSVLPVKKINIYL